LEHYESKPQLTEAALKQKVLWSELLPYEFKQRMADCPVVYLPLGLCEPHGQISAMGLDTIKAEYLCEEAARRHGGIVAPSLGYHIHESGYHAAWLEAELGETNPQMTAMPPFVLLYFYLYQLRSFVNAGFRSIVVISGHSGGNQEDLRTLTAIFKKYMPIHYWVGSDPELVSGLFTGDHAGKYEISQLMYLRPELIDPARRALESDPESGGRLALGADAGQASVELGREIIESSLQALQTILTQLILESKAELKSMPIPMHYAMTEMIWKEMQHKKADWKTAVPFPNQAPVTNRSRWKKYEYL
jgi:creatinine amidohydrolase